MKEIVIATTAGGSLAVEPRLRYGKYRFMILDKVIGVLGATGIKVAYEHNLYLAGYFVPTRNASMLPFAFNMAG